MVETINEQLVYACKVQDVPSNGGVCVKIGEQQIALFHFTRRNEWYATQNLCPHKQQMVLSRGMIGSTGDDPKVACPFHKKTFSLKTGECLSGDVSSIETYPVIIKEDQVYLLLTSNEL